MFIFSPTPQGAELLKHLSSGSVNAEMVSKYTALAACYCLVRYVENALGLTFANTRYTTASINYMV